MTPDEIQAATRNDWGVDTTLVTVGVRVLLANVLHAVGVVGTVERMATPQTGWVEFQPGLRRPFRVADVMEVISDDT